MVTALFALALAATSPSPAPSVFGVWKTPVDAGVIRIAPCGARLCGAVVSSARLRVAPDQKDVRNRDPALRGRAIRGLTILEATAQGPGRWGAGWIYNPDDGGTYKASIEMVSPDRLHLKGCIVAPLCRTQTWTRAR